MVLSQLAIVGLLSNSLLILSQAATITLFTPAIVEPSGGPQISTQAFGTPSIVGVSAIDVLPGNVTEYAVGQVATIFTEAGSGTATSLSALVTTVSYTFQEGASFVGNSVNFVEFTASANATQTISTPVTGVVGCTATAPSSASETQFRCAEVEVVNGTSTITGFFSATAAPLYTLTESTPPPAASATTQLIFPSGVPTGTSSATQLYAPFPCLILISVIYASLSFAI